MSKSIHLIMPMAGSGSRFFNQGYAIPKPLIPINNKPFFYWATMSIAKFVELRSLTFVVLQEHIEKFQIDTTILEYFPTAKIRILQEVLNGAVLTSTEGTKDITDDAPIVFNDCDHMFQCNSFVQFCNKGKFDTPDGALLTFESNDPKFSFLAYDEAGNVIKTVEKQVISNDAICGAYYFKNRAIFAEAVQKYLRVCEYKEFFMSGVYNIMAEEQKKISSFRVDWHLPYGTPEEYEVAKDSQLFRVVE
ncbi:sugar phosphate nucleotidyltransferase [Paenibacillus hunanensis]|uniref:dTDP-glucose pyrophosphorylase n=1 Tax=Paenibacillus hunanensis TaxID=539262 RepID=A0ABU1ITG3_9BACL|nr:sugar phosphate nucleotidyltransferase [Paenibacillus hunanensis]MDR6242550.1 dTDP-glucose pyrophosphorylase [Paenibacillus hunanensis]GGJ00896.1 glycosyl transferase family 2 [Paenibacillus hunanensis]